MKTVLVYDSIYGNTELLARAISTIINGEIKLARVNDVKFSDMKNLDLLIIGAPTHGGRSTQQILNFIDTVVSPNIKGVSLAVFDTRLTSKLVGVFGYAARRISDNLVKQGAILVMPPEGFFVKGTKGPLVEGEMERSKKWANTLIESINKIKGS
jgi:flavodoxin